MLIIEVWIEGWIANQKLNAFLINRCNSYILRVINGKVPIPPVWWQFLQFELMFLINYLSKKLIQTVGTATKLGDWNKNNHSKYSEKIETDCNCDVLKLAED